MAKTKKIEKLGWDFNGVTEPDFLAIDVAESMQRKINELIEAVNKLSEPKTSARTNHS